MTKLEELKATRAAAWGAYDAAWDAYDAAYEAARAACAAARAAYDAYEAELKKTKGKENELELSTNEAHRT